MQGPFWSSFRNFSLTKPHGAGEVVGRSASVCSSILGAQWHRGVFVFPSLA